jgi:hypothetical protein
MGLQNGPSQVLDTYSLDQVRQGTESIAQNPLIWNINRQRKCLDVEMNLGHINMVGFYVGFKVHDSGQLMACRDLRPHYLYQSITWHHAEGWALF